MPRRFASAYRRRILGCHDVGAFHEGDQAGGRVSGVADRRGGEHDRSARNVDVGDQSVVSPEFGTFRGLRGFLGIFRVLADFGNLRPIFVFTVCFTALPAFSASVCSLKFSIFPVSPTASPNHQLPPFLRLSQPTNRNPTKPPTTSHALTGKSKCTPHTSGFSPATHSDFSSYDIRIFLCVGFGFSGRG